MNWRETGLDDRGNPLDPIFNAAERYEGIWIAWKLPTVAHRVKTDTGVNVATFCGLILPWNEILAAIDRIGLDGCKRCVRGAVLR